MDTTDNEQNFSILEDVFKDFLVKGQLISYPYKLDGKISYDFGLKFKSDVAVSSLVILEEKLQNYKESIIKLFSKNFVVMWFPRFQKKQQYSSNPIADSSKIRSLLINTINSDVLIHRRNEYSFNKKYLCYVNEYALAMLPILRRDNFAEKCMLLLLVDSGNSLYILLQKQHGFYNSFGGLLMNVAKSYAKTKTLLAKDFAVSTLEKYFNISLDAKCYDSISKIQTIDKNLDYKVLGKTFICKNTTNILTLTFDDLERLGLGDHSVSTMLKKKQKNIIVGDDFIMVGINSDGSLKKYDKTLYPIANNIPAFLGKYFKNTI